MVAFFTLRTMGVLNIPIFQISEYMSARVGARRAAGTALWAGGCCTHPLYKGRGSSEYGFQFKRTAVRADDLFFGFFFHAGSDVVFGVAIHTTQVIIWHLNAPL